MEGIVIFGGTVEGRQLAERLQNTPLQLHICVATEYGASLLPKGENVHVYSRRMDALQMEQFLSDLDVAYCVDATHPYAVEVTDNIMVACRNVELPYIRVMRDEEMLEEGQKSQLIFAADMAEAVEYLTKVTGNIFITTGSKELEKYTVIPDYQTRCVARVLPTLPVMEKCKELGFEGKNLIGMQGPFSEEMNCCMLKQVNAAWMVTKNSGRAGGYVEKCEAALRLGVNILVIGRPEQPVENGKGLEETVQFLQERYGIEDTYLKQNPPGNDSFSSDESKPGEEEQVAIPGQSYRRTIYLVAMGPGSDKLLTREAMEVLEQSDVLIGAERVLKIWPAYKQTPYFISYKNDEIIHYLQGHPEYRKVAICYSGDIGFYSGAKGMKEIMKMSSQWDIHPVSGISSVTYFLNKIGVPWGEVKLVSCHGQETDLTSVLADKKKVCALLGQRDAVSDISKQLLDCKMEYVRLTVGERLSYPEERILTGCPEEFLNQEFDNLSVLLLECKYG